MKISVQAIVQDIDTRDQAPDESLLGAVLAVQEFDFSDPVDGPTLLRQLAIQLRVANDNFDATN